MTREVKIEKVNNGYIVKSLDFSGCSLVFKTFAELVDHLCSYFDEGKAST